MPQRCHPKKSSPGRPDARADPYVRLLRERVGLQEHPAPGLLGDTCCELGALQLHERLVVRRCLAVECQKEACGTERFFYFHMRPVFEYLIFGELILEIF